jgi:hypothetical protein
MLGLREAVWVGRPARCCGVEVRAAQGGVTAPGPESEDRAGRWRGRCGQR